MQPSLVVLAAGMGSRYGGLKQIDPVGPNGETILDYSIFDANRAGFSRAIFVIRRDFEEIFRQQIIPRFYRTIETVCVFQEIDDLPDGFPLPAGRTKPWGTGHAVWSAREAVQEPFAVINADDFYGADAFAKLARFLERADDGVEPATYAMAGFRLDRTLSEHGTVSRGVCTADKEGMLLGVREFTAIEKTASGARNKGAEGATMAFRGDEIVSMNCWGFTPNIFEKLGRQLRLFLNQKGSSAKDEFYLPAAVAELIAKREATVRILPTASEWFGVTYREDTPHVMESIRRLVGSGAYPKRLWS